MYFLSLQSLTRSVFATPPTQNQLSTRLSTRLSSNCRVLVVCSRAPLGNALDRTAQQPRRPTKLTLSEFGGIGEAQGNPSYISAWWGWACKATVWSCCQRFCTHFGKKLLLKARCSCEPSLYKETFATLFEMMALSFVQALTSFLHVADGLVDEACW